MNPLWRIELFGGLRVVSDDDVITRFRSHKTGALLAFLAFYPHRSHPRDLLTELLWPEEDLDASRMKLRTALASLRRQLEPPGIPAGAVIMASRLAVQLNPAQVTTDVAQFEAALQAARVPDTTEPIRRLEEAIALCRGPLLPGYFEAWVLPEQQRLSEQLHRALREVIGALEQAGDLPRALGYASRAVAADPLREEAHHELIRLHGAAGQPAAALRQYRELERLLREELGETPSPALRELAGRIERDELPAPRIRASPAPPAGESDHRIWSALSTSCSPEAGLPPAVTEASGYLPPSVNRFFGREAEIARVRKLLLGEGVRLVTLTGPGGSGKTRLALEAAVRLREALDGAVWFVPLADLSDPQRIVDAIHGALRLPRLPQREPREQVVEAVSRPPSLLVLDNLEHLMPAAVPIIRDVLERAPLLQCLVTSRQILELTPEREIAVGPLPVPVESRELRVESPARTGSADPATLNPQLSTLFHCPSVALFVDRAQRASLDFQLTGANAAAVAALCRRLEGIPLAIELAAARAQRLSPGRMLVEVEQRFDLLVSRKRDLPSRHQTLRAAIDWSYRLLSPAAQPFFARLFVIRGGFSPEAAARVAGGEAGCPTEAREFLALLRECSLVQAEEQDGEMRFRMLETLREYGEALLAAPDETERQRHRHAAYFLEWAEAAQREVRGANAALWLDRLERDHDNLRAALDWLAGQVCIAEAMRLALALRPFWWDRYHRIEGQRRLLALVALTDPSDPSPERAHLIYYAGHFAWWQGNLETAHSLFQQSLPLLELINDQPLRAGTFGILDHLAMEQNGDSRAARAFYEQGHAAYLALGYSPGIAGALFWLGQLARHGGDLPTARARWEEALAIHRETGDPAIIGGALEPLAELAYVQGDVAATCVYLRERVALQREVDRHRGVVPPARDAESPTVEWQDGRAVRRLWEESLAFGRAQGAKERFHYLAEIIAEQGDFPAAQAILEESLTLFLELDRKFALGYLKGRMAAIARCRGEYPAAQALLREVLALHRERGDAPNAVRTLASLRAVASDQGNFAAARALLEESLAVSREVDRKLAVARILHHLGVLARREGDLGRAQGRLEQSLDLCRQTGEQHDVALVLASLGSMLAASGSHEAARSLLTESLAIRQLRFEQLGIAECLEGLGALDSMEAGGDRETREQAVRLFAAATALRETIGAPLPPADRAAHDARIAALRAAGASHRGRAARIASREMSRRTGDRPPPRPGALGNRPLRLQFPRC
jgi:predicted ATPase/DNA-binding SARP family transcriptional activator